MKFEAWLYIRMSVPDAAIKINRDHAMHPSPAVSFFMPLINIYTASTAIIVPVTPSVVAIPYAKKEGVACCGPFVVLLLFIGVLLLLFSPPSLVGGFAVASVNVSTSVLNTYSITLAIPYITPGSPILFFFKTLFPRDIDGRDDDDSLCENLIIRNFFWIRCDFPMFTDLLHFFWSRG